MVPLYVSVRPSSAARRLLLHLFSIGGGYFDSPMRLGAFERPGAGVLWIKSGSGRLRLDETEWELKPGPNFWFYDTGHTREFLPVPGCRLVTRAFWFGGPGLEGWLEALDVSHQPQFCLRRPARIYQAYGALLRLARQRPANWEWRVHLLLSGVVGEFLQVRDVLRADDHALPAPITRALDAIEANCARDWKTTELAALVGMSYSAFRILFRETMHESPHSYLQRARLDLARELLTDPKLRIKEIARRLHFSSEYYFSSFFHQHTGISPTVFREHLGPRRERQ